MVAENLVFNSLDPKLAPLLSAEAVAVTRRLLLDSGGSHPAFLRLFPTRPFRSLVSVYERMVAQGQGTHMALRKSFFEDETVAALEAGAVQVVMIGAGMDTLCYRLAARRPDVSFLELDKPEIQRPKVRAFRARGALPDNLTFIPVDLSRRSLAAVLDESPSWQNDRQSVAIAEGLLMYLTETEVRRLFESLHQRMPVGSRVLFSHMQPNDGGKVDVEHGFLNDLLLKFKGEPYQWSILKPKLPAFLESLGFRVDQAPERCDLGRRYLEPAGLGQRPLGRVEHLAVAEKSDPGRA